MDMMIQGQKRSELVLYATLWTVLFAASAASVYLDDSSFDWTSLLSTWKFLAMFCVTFFVHNFCIAPLFVYQDRRWRYGIGVALLFALFFGYQMVREAKEPPKKDNPGMEKTDKDRPQNPSHGRMWKPMGPGPEMDEGPMHGPMEMAPDGLASDPSRQDVHAPADNPPKDHEPDPMMKAKPFGGPSMVASTIMLLLLGLNVGTKYYFKSLDDRKRMKELERDNLNQQLQYLKYQINPHFFMNTLNNIHALVDIDPEEAKHTIEVLSKLMRYVLYEADKPMASLQKELDFLGHYIGLMRIRYTDKVRISVSWPASVPDVQVPSLLFATFVENAFKHGVSYQRDSFIEVSMTVDEQSRELCFLCNNSQKPEMEEQQASRDKAASASRSGGVGLQNAVKRLDLIYGHDYELKIEADAEEHRLLLRLPFLHS